MPTRTLFLRSLFDACLLRCCLIAAALFTAGAVYAQDALSPAADVQAAVEALEGARSDTLDAQQARLRMDALAEVSARHLSASFNLAGIFADAAGTIAVATYEETSSDTRQGGGVGRWLSRLTALAPLVGTGLLLAGETEVASGIALGSTSLAGITGLLNAASARKQQAAAEAEAALRQEQALRQAEGHTLLAILTVDLQSASGALDAVMVDLAALQGGSAGAAQDGEDPAVRYLAALRSLDVFYDAQLLTLRSTLAGAQDSPLLTEASHVKIKEVLADVDDARARWVAVRDVYARAERATLDYLTQGDLP